MSVRHRVSLFALLLAGAPLVAGCNQAELEELRSAKLGLTQELEATRTELSDMRTAAETRRVEVERLTGELATVTTERDSLGTERDELAAAIDAAKTTASAARAEAKAKKDEIDEMTSEKNQLESHRDELVEWVDELLPLAEKQDPRLQKLRDVTDDIAQQVEEYRGLKFKKPFRRRLIHRDQVKTFMRRDMEREMPKEEMDKMVRVMSEFGLIRRDADILEMFEGFMEAGAAAFYKPNTGTFYLIEGKNDRGDRPIVFHELIHALEDQHFDLTKMQTAFEGDSDAGMGIKGLVEGSADYMQERYHKDNPEDVQAMMAAQMAGDGVQRQMQMMQEVPPFLIAAMGLYPYKNGSAYLTALELADTAALDEIFRNPPVSTEQVLHPEKYGVDFPHKITAPDLEAALGDGWEVLDDDSMGELFCGLLLTTNRFDPKLKSNMPVLMGVMDMRTQGVGFKGKIKKAVEGWDGDRYTAAVHDDGESVCVAWASVWDSEDDAKEFAEYYASLLGMRVAGESKPLKDVELPATFTRAADGAISGVQLEGRRVVVVLSAPAEQAEAVFQATWDVTVTPDERDANDGAQ
jgi:hypothetical protein